MATSSMYLDTKLRQQLLALRGEWPGIARHADVSLSWMSQFARGKIPNPGIQTLRQLAIAIDTLGLANRAARLHQAARRASLKDGRVATPETLEGLDSQDREIPADTSPDGGPMGTGQSAAADPPGQA